MNTQESLGFLGISLIEDQLRIAEGIKSANEFQVSHLTQGRVRQPFNFEVFSDNSVVRRFAEDVNRLYETQDFEFKQTSFSLDSRMVMIKKLPVDKALTGEKLHDHVIWEVNQFLISPLEEYVIDFEPLDTDSNDKFDEILIVVVRKKIIEFIKTVFNQTNLALKAIDVDIFSAQRSLQVNYDYENTQRIGLIDVEEKKLNFLILDGQKYFISQDVIFSANNRSVDLNEDSKATLISKELRRIILDHQLGRSIEDLDEIFLYGEALEDELLEDLQNTYDVRIDRANPFKRVKLTSQAKEAAHQIKGERFMISVGAALKCFQAT